MTETEYKLLSSLASVIDIAQDCMDSIDELSGEIYDLQEKAGDIFYKVKDENSDEWDAMQRAEAKIIEKKHKQKGNKNEDNR